MQRRLGVTLVGGFLGAGKTSLLHYFLSEHARSGVALFVESTGTLNLDAKAFRGLCGAMSRTDDVVEEIPALEETAQIDWLTRRLAELAETGEVERVLIETAGTSNATRLARHFGILPGQPGQLAVSAKMDRIICVVDALDFHRAFAGPASRHGPLPYAEFQRAQIEGASLILLNKCDILENDECAECEVALRQMNSHATMLETSYGELPLSFWMQVDTEEQLALAVEERAPVGNGKPIFASDTESSLSSLLYRVHRPFHPGRFWNWFEADHAGLLRLKGLIWMATRNLLVGGISRTRWQSSCGGAGIWWAALPREEWPQDPESLEAMQKVWREPWGDRRQEIVLVGDARDLPEMTRSLHGCLLTDDEFGRPHTEWRTFPDPFPAWDVGAGS